MKKIFAIDIGGTKISIALVQENGKVIEQIVFPNQKGKDAMLSVNQIKIRIQDWIKTAKIKKGDLLGIAAVFPGPVDTKKGIVPWSPNMQGWEGIPLGAILRKAFKTRVVMDNDANAAVLGEKYFGAGKKVAHLIYMTVSTGIGGGLIVNDQLVRGENYCGGEVGHMIIVPNGRVCGCGQKGCLEAYASGTAIAKVAMSLAKKYPSWAKKLRAESGKITAKDIKLAALKGDKRSIQVLQEAGFYLGIGLANLTNILNPGLIILGGGVISKQNAMWLAMKKSWKQHSWTHSQDCCQIIPTDLGASVGNLGAAALVLSTRAS